MLPFVIYVEFIQVIGNVCSFDDLYKGSFVEVGQDSSRSLDRPEVVRIHYTEMSVLGREDRGFQRRPSALSLSVLSVVRA